MGYLHSIDSLERMDDFKDTVSLTCAKVECLARFASGCEPIQSGNVCFSQINDMDVIPDACAILCRVIVSKKPVKGSRSPSSGLRQEGDQVVLDVPEAARQCETKDAPQWGLKYRKSAVFSG